MVCGVRRSFDPEPIEVWNLKEGRIKQTQEGHLFGVGDLALIPETQRFVSAGDSTLRIWDLGLPDAIRLTMFEPEVELGNISGNPGLGDYCDRDQRNCVGAHPPGRHAGDEAGRPRSERISEIALLSHDGRWLACGVADGSVRLRVYKVVSSRWQTKFHDAAVNVIAFFPDDRMLATGSEDRRVNLVATEDGKHMKHSRAHRDDLISCLAVSNNGRLIASEVV